MSQIEVTYIINAVMRLKSRFSEIKIRYTHNTCIIYQKVHFLVL